MGEGNHIQCPKCFARYYWKRLYDRISGQDQYGKWHSRFRAIGNYCEKCGHVEISYEI